MNAAMTELGWSQRGNDPAMHGSSATGRSAQGSEFQPGPWPRHFMRSMPMTKRLDLPARGFSRCSRADVAQAEHVDWRPLSQQDLPVQPCDVERHVAPAARVEGETATCLGCASDRAASTTYWGGVTRFLRAQATF